MKTKSINEFMNLSVAGTSPHLKEVKTKESKIPPALLFKKREKILHLKWLSFLFLSHILVLMLNTEPPIVQKETILEVESGYEILNLPVWNFSKVPNKGSKLKVSIFNEESKTTLTGFLRSLGEDQLGPTGKKAELEIKGEDLLKVKKAKGPWQVYPSINELQSSKGKGVYEINL